MTPCEYTFMVDKLRMFFQSYGFMEVPAQSQLSTLSACEDPSTLTVFSYGGQVWPLPQSGQFMLDLELLRNPTGARGYFCVSTSYRNEHSPELGRHDGIFPMVEYAMRGGKETLLKMQRHLLNDLGFGKLYSDGQYPRGEYREKGVDAAVREESLRREYGPVYFLANNTGTPRPFFSAYNEDVILHGMETVSGSVRSRNAHEMRRMFYSIDDGRYAKTLFSHFTRKRVERDLDLYLSHPMVERCGGGVGLFRLLRALRLSGLESKVPLPSTLEMRPRPCDRTHDHDDASQAHHDAGEDSDHDHPHVCDVASFLEKVVVDRVHSNTDLRKLGIAGLDRDDNDGGIEEHGQVGMDVIDATADE